MISYREWKLLEDVQNIDAEIESAIQKTMADIEAEISKYIGQSPAASTPPTPGLRDKASNWVAQKGQQVKDYLNSSSKQGGPTRLHNLSKVFGFDQKGGNKQFNAEVDAKRRAAVAGGMSPEEAARTYPYPTKTDNLKRAFTGSGNVGKDASWKDWFRDRFGNALGFQKEWVETEAFLENLIVARDLQNLLLGCGVSRFRLSESDSGFEQLRDSIANHLRQLGSTIKGLFSGRPAAAPQQGSPSPQGSPSVDKKNVLKMLRDKKKITEVFAELGLDTQKKEDVETFLKMFVDQANSMPNKDKTLQFDYNDVVKKWSSIIKRGQIPLPIRNVLNKYQDEPEPEPQPEPPQQAPPSVEPEPAVEPPPVPKEVKRDMLRDKIGFVKPTIWQKIKIKDVSSQGDYGADELKDLIYNKKIDPAEIIRLRPELRNLVIRILRFTHKKSMENYSKLL